MTKKAEDTAIAPLKASTSNQAVVYAAQTERPAMPLTLMQICHMLQSGCTIAEAADQLLNAQQPLFPYAALSLLHKNRDGQFNWLPKTPETAGMIVENSFLQQTLAGLFSFTAPTLLTSLSAEQQSTLAVLMPGVTRMVWPVAKESDSSLLMLAAFPADPPDDWQNNTALQDLVHALSMLVQYEATREERKQSDRMLRKTSRRMTNILQSISEAYFSLDREFRFTYVNRRGEEMVGRQRQELLGKIIWEVFPEKIGMKFYTEYTNAMHNQSAACFQEHYETPDVWVTVRVFPSQDGLSIYIQDITGEVSMENSLQQIRSRLQRSLDGIVRALVFAVEVRDPYTATHQRRVGALAGAIARAQGQNQEQVARLQMAGLLHDVGKISVPSEIMTRPGALNSAEMSIIKTHPEIGFNMLRGIEFDAPVALVALQHHERLNGSGYPQGLRAEEICPEAQLMGVADVVEAMASHRPYRPALGIERALDEVLAHRGKLYNTEAVDACFEVFRLYGFDFDQLLLAEPLAYP